MFVVVIVDFETGSHYTALAVLELPLQTGRMPLWMMAN